jgi:hypothetical protein
VGILIAIRASPNRSPWPRDERHFRWTFAPLSSASFPHSLSRLVPLLVMRLIVGISLLLLGVGSLSCRMESTALSVDRTPPPLEWVRTVDGWERPVSWATSTTRSPRLHPFVVAFGQGLFSALALAVSRRESEC